jgi:hypothetical protein
VVCTDRGQHNRLRIQRLTDYRAQPSEITEDDITRHNAVCEQLGVTPTPMKPHREDRILFSGPNTTWTAAGSGQPVRPSWPAVAPARPDGGITYVFPCHGCGRAPQLRAEHLADTLDQLYAAGPPPTDAEPGQGQVWELDVSYAD